MTIFLSFFIFLRASGIRGGRWPAGNVARENRVEKAVLDSRIFQIQIPYEIFYVFPPGFSIHRTWIFADWKLVFIFKSNDICFADVHHGTNHSQIHPVQIGTGREGIEASLIDQ